MTISYQHVGQLFILLLSMLLSSVVVAEPAPTPNRLNFTAIIYNTTPAGIASKLSNVQIQISLPNQTNFVCINGATTSDANSGCSIYHLSTATLNSSNSENHSFVIVGPGGLPQNGTIQVQFSFTLNGSQFITPPLTFTIINGTFANNTSYFHQWNIFPTYTVNVYTITGSNEIHFDVLA